MQTECIVKPMEFHPLNHREVIGKFDGGPISSDGGGVLLREIEHRTHILKYLSQCFTDYRDPDRIEHSVESLVKQRVIGLALGYEDLNDHDVLRHDALLAVLSDKPDPTGADRNQAEDKGNKASKVFTLIICESPRK